MPHRSVTGRSRVLGALAVAAVCALALSAASCGSGGGGNTTDMVLLSFNLPNISGVPLNQPLIFTFSADVDPGSINPNVLRVQGNNGPFFEDIVVDGNLVALLPRTPNRDTFSDSGMLPSTTYTVSMSVFPAASTITSTSGRPLLHADTYQFTTLPTYTFIEPRRPINHGTPPPVGHSDDLGCLQNPDNSLFVSPLGEKQFGSGPGARLLCEINEGAPEVILDQCIPTQDAPAIGTPSAVTPGYIDLPAIRVRVNEPLNPATVTPINSNNLGIAVQLWRVGDTDKLPLPGNPEQIETNTPVTVQSISSQEIILVAQHEVLQGTYCVNLRGTIQDLTGQGLDIAATPDPIPGGYGPIDSYLIGKVPPGFRIYFVTLQLPSTPQAFSESFGNNLSEWGDNSSGNSEPGVFTRTVPTTNPVDYIGGGAVPASPALTLVNSTSGIGQSTTANWNNGFHFLNLSNLIVNGDADAGNGRLKAVWKPSFGSGEDGVFDTDAAPYGPGPGDVIALNTDTGSIDGDGIFEFERVHIGAGDVVTATGSHPLVILCRGDFLLEGTIALNGEDGGPGLDTDGTTIYSNPGHFPCGGAGGLPGAGGGVGGGGGDPFGVGAGKGGLCGYRFDGDASTAADFQAISNPITGPFSGGPGAFTDGTNSGGGGGGFGAVGNEGANSSGTGAGNGGPFRGDNIFTRLLSDFQPDRGYMPNTDIQGGTGGGGGGADDDNGASETGDSIADNGDDGGGGGGGGGGALVVFVGGTTTFASGSVLQADGGAGGSTYNKANTLVGAGPDMNVGTSDDVVAGLIPGAVPSGQGGPGGGGSGGGALFFSVGAVGLHGFVSCGGGAGGQSGSANRVGGAGGGGRFAVGTNSGIDTTGATWNLATAFGFGWAPTVNLDSAGVSQWYDLSSPTADFQVPFYTTNFATLTSLLLIQGVDWDATLEFQGADNLSPIPGGATPPTSATGLTQWDSNIDSVDFKRFVRYRWRFHVADNYPGWQLSTQPPGTGKPLPQVLDITIPFNR
jgi:hypothetical protein